MTIANENASSELVEIFAEIHNLLSSHCRREKMDVQTPWRNGFADKVVFCVYFEDGVHFSQKEESQQVGRQRVHTPLMVISTVTPYGAS